MRDCVTGWGLAAEVGDRGRSPRASCWLTGRAEDEPRSRRPTEQENAQPARRIGWARRPAGQEEVQPARRIGWARRPAGEDGFTFVELMVGMMMLAVLLGLGVFALRQFWLTHSLRGGREQIVTQLRQIQQQSVSESHPLVYGARFRVGSPTFGLVKFDPHSTTTATDDTCVETSKVTLGSNVQVSEVDFTDAAGITSLCRAQIAGATLDEFAFFYARGTATQGSMTLVVPALTGKSLSLSVTSITGRVNSL